MKFSVDEEACIGCGACEETCPEVFELPSDVSQVKLEVVPEALRESALVAEEECPATAISHVE